MFLGLLDPNPLVRYESGSFYHQAKIVRNLFDLLSLKYDVNVP
jgi:hypothetical protein